MADILDELRKRGQYKALPSSGAQYRGMMGNPRGTSVLRIIDGKLFEDEPIAWHVFSEGEPVPVLLGIGPIQGDYAVATKKDTAIGQRYFTVVHRGKYYDNFTQWLYAVCGEMDPAFSPRWADRGPVTDGHSPIGGVNRDVTSVTE
ncbi:hypothetical protein ACVINW_006342 [Bradyrhizobium sp. USDA 4461]